MKIGVFTNTPLRQQTQAVFFRSFHFYNFREMNSELEKINLIPENNGNRFKPIPTVDLQIPTAWIQLPMVNIQVPTVELQNGEPIFDFRIQTSNLTNPDFVPG